MPDLYTELPHVPELSCQPLRTLLRQYVDRSTMEVSDWTLARGAFVDLQDTDGSTGMNPCAQILRLANRREWHLFAPVSYTHLTLPTIYSV